MRRPVLLILSLVAGLAGAGAAHAQLSKPHRDPFVKVRPAPVAAAPPRKPTPLVSLAPPARLALTGLTGLPPVGDASPACRSQCSQARFTCEAAGDDGCATRWTQCLRVCSVPSGNRRPR